MRAKWIFTLLVLWVLLVAIPVISVPRFIAGLDTDVLRVAGAIAMIVPLVLLWLLYVNLLHPISAINNGMFLVRAQDFTSRLVKVGQKDADDLVGMFNKMIDRLKEERLRNIEQSHFLQLLIQASPMGIIILDYDEKITMANPTMLAMLGLDTKSVEGRMLDDFKGE
ncbi:MAG: PAS domain-containing protein, partial [Paramuribaculum sp.]|nr:PAS domain-containing protein [Paramuribaculum sp.]